MESTSAERKVPVYKLLYYKTLLAQTRSFSESVERCNFTTYTGWKGKSYVNDNGHDVPEYKPDMRGVIVLETHYLQPGDYVILTEAQYRDYRIASGLDALH